MKKLLSLLVTSIIVFSAFAYDITSDIFLGGNYNYTLVTNNKKDAKTGYQAEYNSFGISIGTDIFFNPCPVGVYFRNTFYIVPGVDRFAGGKQEYLKNTDAFLNYSMDIGAVYTLPIAEHFSINFAPAISMMYISSEYTNIDYASAEKTRAAIESTLAFGFTGDIGVKYKYKYLAIEAGCAGSFYPLSLVTSSDSSISYKDSNFKNPFTYNIKPYFSIGITLREINKNHVITNG